jgi:membrane-bound serine protease (ClpP class)
MFVLFNHFLFVGALLAVAIPSLVLLFFLLQLVRYSRHLKRHPSAAGLIGLTGRAESEIAAEGLVFVRGELWRARSASAIQRGTRVRIIGFRELALEVEVA